LSFRINVLVSAEKPAHFLDHGFQTQVQIIEAGIQRIGAMA
jgi:hypothetical protein